MKKEFDTYVRDGVTRVPLNADEEKTLLWGGWKVQSDAGTTTKSSGGRRKRSGDDLPTHDSPPQTPDQA